jgi:hypothetical protein
VADSLLVDGFRVWRSPVKREVVRYQIDPHYPAGNSIYLYGYRKKRDKDFALVVQLGLNHSCYRQAFLSSSESNILKISECQSSPLKALLCTTSQLIKAVKP